MNYHDTNPHEIFSISIVIADGTYRDPYHHSRRLHLIAVLYLLTSLQKSFRQREAVDNNSVCFFLFVDLGNVCCLSSNDNIKRTLTSTYNSQTGEELNL